MVHCSRSHTFAAPKFCVEALGSSQMNEHIRRGNQALKSGDLDGAQTAFIDALDDPDPLSQRIARNRLYDTRCSQRVSLRALIAGRGSIIARTVQQRTQSRAVTFSGFAIGGRLKLTTVLLALCANLSGASRTFRSARQSVLTPSR